MPNTRTEGDKTEVNEEEAILRAQTVEERHESQLLKKANAVSVGIGYRERRGQLTDEVV